MPTSSRREFPAPARSRRSGSFTPAARFTTIRRSLLQRSRGRSSMARRLFVASSSNFGAPLARQQEAPGAILSLDVSGGADHPVAVPADFATGGGQASAVGGKVILYSAQSPAFINGVKNPNASTKDLPSVSLPLGISFNNGFGRPWFANAPNGSDDAGTISVVDPGGFPLAGAPDPIAGGVFTGTITNRSAASIGGLTSAAVATALIDEIARLCRSEPCSLRRSPTAAFSRCTCRKVSISSRRPARSRRSRASAPTRRNPRIRTSSRAPA